MNKKPFDSPYEGDETTRAARQTIDEDINQFEIEIRSLKRKRNELASISVLPPEVLSKIFIFVRDTMPNHYHRNPQTQWIRIVGHICHQWREVALSCPTLWSIPVFTNPELVQEMMQRSKMAALTIKLTTGSWTPRILGQLENAMAQIFRIRFLHLAFGSHPDKLKNIFSTLSQPAPHLERVVLTDGTYHVHSTQYSLPKNAFTDAPALRSVELDRFNFVWESAIFKHDLTTLKLRNVRVASPEGSTIRQMLEALAHMPRLRTLELVNSIPPHTTASGNEPIPEFDALEYLTLDAKAPECIQLLRCIKYPPHITLNLHCSANKVEDYANTLVLVGEVLRRPIRSKSGIHHNPRVFRSAGFLLEYDGTTDICFFDRADGVMQSGLYATATRNDADVRIRFHISQIVSQSHDHILKELCNAFDLSSLESLTLDWCPGHNQSLQSIREGIGKLPKLKCIRIGQCFSQVCSAIKEDLDGREPVPIDELGAGRTRSSARRKKLQCIFPPVTVFPTLKTLIFQGADFNENRCPGSLDNLVDMLIQRSNMNGPIHELSLEDCRGVRTEQKRQLGEVVVDLLVDGDTVDVMELNSEDDLYVDSYDEDEDENYEDEDEDYFYDASEPYDYNVDDAFGWFPF